MPHRLFLQVSAWLLAAILAGCSSTSTKKTNPGTADTGSETGDFSTDSTSDTDTVTDVTSDSFDSDSTSRCEIPAVSDGQTVATTMGAVRGVLTEGVTSFKGIPFAAPPVGALRFAPPQAPACIDGVLDASAYGPVCPQLDGGDGEFIGEEDCLTLNIWTPAALPATSPGKPVMVFIHGGGNGLGSASETSVGTPLYDGATLAATEDVLVVTIEYRLGALGWIVNPAATAAGTPSGNYGLLDQIAALKWIQANIAGFGGDPNRVTIFGESAGALNTCMLLVSPLAAGLFHGAIMQSGGCPGYSVDQVTQTTTALLESAGCPNTDQGVDCLRGLTARQIVEALPPVIEVSGFGGQTFYQPHVDGVVIPDNPMKLLAGGAYNQVPFIVGANADETARYVPQSLSAAEYAALVAATFKGLAAKVLQFYPADAFNSPAEAYIRLSTDAKFVCPSRAIATRTSAAQSAPVYRYFFTQDSGAALTSQFGAFHGLELLFVFGKLHIAGFSPSPEQESLSSAMMTYWAGLESGQLPTSNIAPQWLAYDATVDNAMVLQGGAIAMENGIRSTECDFWDSVIDAAGALLP